MNLKKIKKVWYRPEDEPMPLIYRNSNFSVEFLTVMALNRDSLTNGRQSIAQVLWYSFWI